MGSTGSIGVQTLEIARANPERLQIEALSALSNADLLIRQALEFRPNCVVIAEQSKYGYVKDALQKHDIKVYTGADSLCQVVQMDTIDMVLGAIVGIAGLKSTVAAIKAGKSVALANKETLVVAGAYVTQLAREKGVNIYPVDSEHSAIFQCLAGEYGNKIEKVILTASGGPFREKQRELLANVTKEDALQHPNWNMGAKITIDSATMMNKGLEIIEAGWLFGLKSEQIDVIIHPQSVIHSLVCFEDGSVKAQLGLPDMHIPIQYALFYPERILSSYPRFNFRSFPNLTFQPPDSVKFPALNLAREAMKAGGVMPCVMNAANEAAVGAFLDNKIGFLDITDLVEKCMQRAFNIAKPTLEDLINCDREIRIIAAELCRKKI